MHIEQEASKSLAWLRFTYKCDCGVHFTVEKRFSVKQLMTLKCRQCDKTVKDMKVEVIIGI